jgi:26S proteasome regulatory subunit N3
MNIIIRSYLAQNLYEQAHNFITKTTFPPSCTNNQYARYLYYVGRIKSVQMEYSESQANLIQAQRKSPEVGALGFRVQTQKLLILVELLMGDIPNRQIFNQEEYQVPLAPYFAIVSTAKSGDMKKF